MSEELPYLQRTLTAKQMLPKKSGLIEKDTNADLITCLSLALDVFWNSCMLVWEYLKNIMISKLVDE